MFGAIWKRAVNLSDRISLISFFFLNLHIAEQVGGQLKQNQSTINGADSRKVKKNKDKNNVFVLNITNIYIVNRYCKVSKQ